MTSGLFAFLQGTSRRWRDLDLGPDEFLALCEREEIGCLVFAQLAGADGANDWPSDVRSELARIAREAAAVEMVRRREVAAVLESLRACGVRAIVIKGAALAYTVYDDPIARPRLDTDLLIDDSDITNARTALAARGYTAPPYCDTLMSQFQMEKTDGLGVQHVFDVHWKISTQPVFAGVLTYADAAARAVPVPALGRDAAALSTIDALLLACIHPAMHHRNAERLLWSYDIHLLASRLTRDELRDFAERARQKQVAAICAHALRRAQAAFATSVPAEMVTELESASAEPSAAYLASHRKWHDELASSMRAMATVGDRVRLVRDVLLPRPSYMLGAYGLQGKPLALCLLPALYVHRNVRGAWKILTGKK